MLLDHIVVWSPDPSCPQILLALSEGSGVQTRPHQPLSQGMWEEVRHSQADKVVNNFHGQNPFQFYGQTLIFTAKTDVFVLRFLGLSPFHPNDKISCSIPVPFQWHNFMLKISNCKILCSTPFHSNWYLRPATPSWLPAVDSSPHWEQLQRQYFTDGLGLPGKLDDYLSKSNRSTCS